MANAEKDGYAPSEVDHKWQRIWEERGTNTFTREELESAERPYYNLMMFPYPSAEGLHVGNIYAFTGADVNGRFHRLQGKDVFEPMGFDAFGIHSENFALKTDTHPMDLIPSNVRNFTRQLKRMGGMFDWNHVVDTTDPAYYKWTQWVFLQLLKAGLAEQKEAPVNWCPSCKTVLANEQVDGRGVRALRHPGRATPHCQQWFFKITEYAQRLLDNLAARSTGRRRPRSHRSIGSDGATGARARSSPCSRRRGKRHRNREDRGLHDAGRTRCSVPRTWCCPPSTRSSTRSPRTHGLMRLR